MNRLLLGLTALCLLCGQSTFAQSDKKEPTAEQKEIATLRLDLLSAQKATLEARSETLKIESQLIQLQAAIWNESRDKVRSDLNQLFDCDYDLDAGKCAPKPKAKDSPAEVTK